MPEQASLFVDDAEWDPTENCVKAMGRQIEGPPIQVGGVYRVVQEFVGSTVEEIKRAGFLKSLFD